MVKERKELPTVRTGRAVTVIVLLAVSPPTAVAVIMAVPGAIAVTKPAGLTVATVGALEAQVTVLCVASSGRTVDTSGCVPPTTRAAVVGATVMLATGITGAATTWTTPVAVKLPSAVVTMMVAMPGAMPVTTPVVACTAATAGAVEAHVTALFVALAGANTADSVVVPPAITTAVAGAMATPVTAIIPGAAVTVTTLVSTKLPVAVRATMTAMPAALAVTRPVALTVATALSVVVQKIAEIAAGGLIAAASCWVDPTTTLALSGVTETPVGVTTVTTLMATKPPSVVVAVIIV